jgi:hypothetical protein
MNNTKSLSEYDMDWGDENNNLSFWWHLVQYRINTEVAIEVRSIRGIVDSSCEHDFFSGVCRYTRTHYRDSEPTNPVSYSLKLRA